MSSEAIHQILEQIEADVQSRPSPIEFEMAYQARVAIDRIKFAIKYTEKFAPRTDTIREASLQLLDALERLESVERRFQQRSRSGPEPLALGGDAKWKRQTDRGVVVTPRATFAHLGGRCSRSGEVCSTVLVSMSPNCAEDHAFLLVPEGILSAR
jgi:hypothetical protein